MLKKYLKIRRTIKSCLYIEVVFFFHQLYRTRETESVIAMLNELGWPSLSKSCEDARLILYKIINNLAKVPHEHILTKSY